MKFAKLSEYLEKLEKTASRLAITDILSDLFKESERSEIDKITYLLLGTLAPEYKGITFNIAEKMMFQVLAKTYSKDLEEVRKLYKSKGDLGDAAFILAHEQNSKMKNQNQSVSDVYDELTAIALDSGEDSVQRKIEKTSALLKGLDPQSAKFVARIPVGKLRLGFSDKTILDALSWMETGGKDKKSKLEAAYNILPDVGLLAKNVKGNGVDKTLEDISPKVGTPILPMLAARLKSPSEMIAKMKRVLVEPKFDGLRIQIHYKKDGFKEDKSLRKAIWSTQVKAFTRKPNEVSWMFPELGQIGKFLKAQEIIIDTEAIGVDEQRKTLSNFQTTMTRRRKHDIENIAKKVSITFKVFDVMYVNGKSLIEVPYEERRKILEKHIKSGKLLEIVGFEITDKPERISELMQLELGEGLEGIIVKKADAGYIAGRKGYRWVKMKEKEGQKAKLADTLDLVVMGYYKGRGKRTAFGIGGFLVGVLDGEVVKTITRIGTGLSDVQFKELYQRLTKLKANEKPKEFGDVNKMLVPDVWAKPSLVTEIAADEITNSPMHSSGFALRFPRLVKFRDDKSWTGSTTLSEVKKLVNLQ